MTCMKILSYIKSSFHKTSHKAQKAAFCKFLFKLEGFTKQVRKPQLKRLIYYFYFFYVFLQTKKKTLH